MTTNVDSATVPVRALLVSAPASNQGKTTATAALARWYRRQGLRVQVFKTGPDFLDPMVLEVASGAPVYQLDLWMGGEAHCRALLHRAARDADVILIEGVMGLFDGSASTADLSMRLGVPVLAVIDGSAMAQTFGAIAFGLAHYKPGLQLAGVLANRVGSDGHAAMLKESLPDGVAWFGALPRDEAMGLPSRHLGLVQAAEVADVQARLDRAADALDKLAPALPPLVDIALAPSAAGDAVSGAVQPLTGVSIAIARDAAFAFLYRANLDVLRALGASLVFFSPLAGEPLPPCDAVYLPGGYPELHAQTLSGLHALKDALHTHHAEGRPIVAECGGMLALMETLQPHDGEPMPMWGLLPGHARLERRLVNLGMQSLDLPEGEMRGHTFHHASVVSEAEPAMYTRAQRQHGKPEAVHRIGRLHASFFHMYFPSCPLGAAALFHPGVPHAD
ncbi:MAG: cobyrinate a,c-diamide synthase [Aquabacterium sp.]